MTQELMQSRESTMDESYERVLAMGGGWSAKMLFDDAVQRHLNGKPQDVNRAETVARHASGMSAVENLNRYTRLTGHQFSETPSAGIANGVHSLFPWDDLLKRFSPGRDSEQWVERLCAHMGCARRNLDAELTRLTEMDPKPTGQPGRMIRDWSWPLLQRLLDISLDCDTILPDPRYIQTPFASYCWRNWYRDENNLPVLIGAPDYSGLTISQWTVWRLVHDAAHLLHLALCPTVSDPMQPAGLWTMEAVAMLAEKRFYEALQNGAFINVTGLDIPFDQHRVMAMLLWGLAERALRVDYDFAVHMDGQPVNEWVLAAQRRTGMSIGALAFAREFHGMPGFSAGYMAGIIALEEQASVAEVIRGSSRLTLKRYKPEDAFSRSLQTDIPALRPQHAVAIQKVGARAIHAPITFLNPFTGQEEHGTVDTQLSVSLSDDQRGIHMSRLQEAVISLDRETWLDLSDAAQHLASHARTLQRSANAEASLELKTTVRTTTPRTGRASSQPVSIWAKTEICDDQMTNTVGLSIGVITACPCTIAYSRLRLDREVATIGAIPEGYALTTPTFTHSQPGIVSVTVSRVGTPPPYALLYRAVRATSHLVESVLKRPDEHHLVEQAHQFPQFCEDLCRSVATALAASLMKDDVIEVDADLDESIHPHRAYAHLSSTASELWNLRNV